MQPSQPAVVKTDQIADATKVERVDGAIIDQMESSALSMDHAKRLKLRLATPIELEAMGRKPVKTMVVPYFGLDGLPIDFQRYRYLEETRTLWEQLTNKKTPRYFQAAGTGLHAYFPPFVPWAEVALDVTKPLLITEGEKKAACTTAQGYPTIGLGGVDCFASKKDDSALLPELMDIKWAGRDVTIIYDSDAATNPNVLAASVRLGRKLMAYEAKVKIAQLPPMKDGSKQGVDDFIVAVKKANESPRAALDALIAKAHTELFERELALYDFNRQFVYLRDLDRVIVRDDGVMLDPNAFITRAYSSFKHREWRTKTGKDGSSSRIAEVVSTAKEWMEWEQRLMCKTLSFAPGEGEFADHDYNLWRGWPVSPEEGDVTLWNQLLDKLFMNALPEERKWFEQWCAWPLQHPGAKLKTAVLLWSHAQGNGKSTVLEALRAVYGDLYAPMNDDAVDLVWTDWMVNKLLVGVDDLDAKDAKDHAAKWKNLITAPRITIQKRHTHPFEIRSCVNFIMTSNAPNALKLPPQDRRYFIHNAAEWGTKKEREAFFVKVYKWLENGGAGALMAHLLAIDTKDFNPDAPAPITESKLTMQDISKGPLEHWVECLVEAPDSVLRVGPTVIQGDLWTADDLCAIYNQRPDNKTTVTRGTMSAALSNAGLPKAYKGVQVRIKSGLGVRMVIVRNVDKWEGASGPALREHYEKTRLS